jgi:succinate dehydrogenase / fumarate reductase, cytochrome b subunit
VQAGLKPLNKAALKCRTPKTFGLYFKFNNPNAMTNTVIPQAFVWRRLHSLMGLWLVIFITEHLLVNSQAALFIGNDGKGFIGAANALEELPYLQVIEVLFLALPILIHAIWGIKYLFTAKYNSFRDTGHTPYFPEYSRNRAYTWQRITSWVLVFGILAHVIHMRFVERPISTEVGSHYSYLVRIDADNGLYTLAERLNVQLYDEQKIQAAAKETPQTIPKTTAETPEELIQQQSIEQHISRLDALKKRPLKKGQVIAVADNFGTAELLMLRDTFKMPIMLVLYTLFVFSACYHAFNGLWTFMISWGIIQSHRSEQLMLKVCNGLMLLVGCLGLAAIWITYWINLYD